MGISTAVSIALSGLKNNQTETELVSKNIANADRPGYTAKRLVRVDDVVDGQNTGIRAVVQRTVATEVVRQLNASTSTTAYLTAKSDALAQIDRMLGSTSAGFSLSGLTETLNQKLQTLAASPDNQNAQLEAVNAAQVLASTLNQVSDDVQQMRTDIETGIGAGIADINTLLGNISEFNTKIMAAKAQGGDTTDMEDARDLAISNLSQWLDVKTYANSNGSVYVYTQSGATLVASQPTHLSFDQRGTLTAQTEWSADPGKRQVGTITAGSGGLGTVDLVANGSIRSGKLAALLELRDTTLVNLQSQLDDIAVSLARAMSDVTVPGTAATSGAQTGFDLDTSKMLPGNSLSVTLTPPGGSPQVFTFIRVDDGTKLPLDDSVTGATNDRVFGIDFTGGPASVALQIQSVLGSGYSVTNPSGSTIRILNTASGTTVNAASVTSTATNVQDGTVAAPLFVDGSGNTPFSGSLDGTRQKTGFASRITVNTQITANPALLVKYDATTLSGDPKRPQALASALSTRQFSFGAETGLVSADGSTTGTLASFLNTVTSFWGGQSEHSKSALDSQKIIQTNLETRNADASNVNIDQEMARLIQIQSAYAANARVFSVVKDMIDTLLRS